jgi:hypothetical protein
VTTSPGSAASTPSETRFQQHAFDFLDLLEDALNLPTAAAGPSEQIYYKLLQRRVAATVSVLKATMAGRLDDTLPDQIVALRERIAELPTSTYQHATVEGRAPSHRWDQPASDQLRDRVADFLAVLLDFLDIPAPATMADTQSYQWALEDRAVNAANSLIMVVGSDPDEALPSEAAYLRKVATEYPRIVYQHAPSPGATKPGARTPQ